MILSSKLPTAHHIKSSRVLFILSPLLFLINPISGCGSTSPSNTPITDIALLNRQHLDLNQLTESASNSVRIDGQWIRCLQPLLDNKYMDHSSRRESVGISHNEIAQCSLLLTRASSQRRPRLLNREWLILDAHEEIKPTLKVASQSQSHLTPLHRSFRQGRWTLSVSLLRLPPDVSSPQHTSHRSVLSTHGTPPPLAHWSAAIAHQASISEWGMSGATYKRLALSRLTPLAELPTPRVGQVIHLELERQAPTIERGGWALHHPLWFSAPILRYILTLVTPNGAHLSRFGASPSRETSSSYANQSEWLRTSSITGEGGEIYLTTTSSWATLHQWLWNSFSPSLESYSRAVSQRLEDTLFSYFLTPRSIEELHRWVQRYFVYTPRPYRPYKPLSIVDFLQNKVGDCKEFTVLSHALLATQGERSYIALTSTKPLPPKALEIPSIGWFDHVLLWRPSASALKLAQLTQATPTPVFEPGLTSYTWFDATAPQIEAMNSTSGQYAYVLLSATRGIWIPIRAASTR